MLNWRTIFHKSILLLNLAHKLSYLLVKKWGNDWWWKEQIENVKMYFNVAQFSKCRYFRRFSNRFWRSLLPKKIYQIIHFVWSLSQLLIIYRVSGFSRNLMNYHVVELQQKTEFQLLIGCWQQQRGICTVNPRDKVGDPLARAESLHRRAANRKRIEPFPAMNNIPSIAELLMLDEVRATLGGADRITTHHLIRWSDSY